MRANPIAGEFSLQRNLAGQKLGDRAALLGFGGHTLALTDLTWVIVCTARSDRNVWHFVLCGGVLRIVGFFFCLGLCDSLGLSFRFCLVSLGIGLGFGAFWLSFWRFCRFGRLALGLRRCFRLVRRLSRFYFAVGLGSRRFSVVAICSLVCGFRFTLTVCRASLAGFPR